MSPELHTVLSPSNITVTREPPKQGTVLLGDSLAETEPQSVVIEITACLNENEGKWYARLSGVSGGYYILVGIERLVNQNPFRRIIRIPGNVTRDTFCPQVRDLKSRIQQIRTGQGGPSVWVSEEGVLTHERVHEATAKGFLEVAAQFYESEVEQQFVPNAPGKTQEQAINELYTLLRLRNTGNGNFEDNILKLWRDNYREQGGIDDELRPGFATGVAYLAEIPDLERQIAQICGLRQATWPECDACP